MDPGSQVRSPDPRRARRREAWCALAVFAIAASTFLDSVGGDFVWDDFGNVVENGALRSAARIPDILRSPLAEYSLYYRPVPLLLWMGLLSAFGTAAAAFHVANVALHAASAVLVFLLARRAAPARSPWPALAGAVIFAVHPVNAESVAWISGGVDVCTTFFAVLALYAHARGEPPAWRWRVVSALALLLALLSKEAALAVVPAMVGWDLLFRRDGVRSPALAARAWGPALLVTALYFGLRVHALGEVVAGEPIARNSLVAAPVLLARYLEYLVAPVRLAALHDVRLEFPLLSVETLRAAVPLAALLGLAIVAVRRPRQLGIPLALVILPLLPVVSSQTWSRSVDWSNRFGERHLYLSTVGLGLAVAAVGAWAEDRALGVRRALAVAALLLAATLGVTTARRNLVWRDEVTLWTDAVAKYPSFAFARMNLGLALLDRDPGRAAAEMREAVRLDRLVAAPHLALGMTALERGDPRGALRNFNVVVLAAPGVWQVHQYRAVALRRVGRLADARAEYREALRLNPDAADARRALAELGDASP